jgi:hypothetical protein
MHSQTEMKLIGIKTAPSKHFVTFCYIACVCPA